jgi:PAS domain S-box-containing protein
MKKGSGERAPDPRVPGSFDYTYRAAEDGSLVAEELGETFLKLTGYSREELQGLDAWSRFVHPDDIPQARDIISHLLEGQAWSGSFRIIAKNGSQRVMHLMNRVERDEDGNVVRISGRGLDITEHDRLRAALSERENSLRLIASQVPLITWTVDTELIFTSISGSGLPLLDTEENQVRGMSLQDFFVTEDETFEPLVAHRRALEGEIVAYQIEWGGRCFRVLVEPLNDEAGRIAGVIGVGIDQTTQLDLEAQVRMLTTELVGLRTRRRESATIELDDAPPMEEIVIGDLVLEPGNFLVRRGDDPLPLTPIEFRLFLELARNVGRVLTRPMLMEHVWGYDFLGGAAVVNMAVRRLREKVEADPAHPQLIQTVRGVGYRMVGDHQSSRNVT